jgi:hypothetical protein
MDCETAVQCYIELLTAGPHREDAIDLLLGEVKASPLLGESKKERLTNALTAIRQTGSFGCSPAVEELRSVLLELVEGFQEKLAPELAALLTKALTPAGRA